MQANKWSERLSGLLKARLHVTNNAPLDESSNEKLDCNKDSTALFTPFFLGGGVFVVTRTLLIISMISDKNAKYVFPFAGVHTRTQMNGHKEKK